MLNLLYALRLRTPPQKEEARAPRDKGFIIDIYDRLERNEPFSLVHIVVDKGSVEDIHKLTGGRMTGPRGICVVVPVGHEYEVHQSLDKLTEAHFESQLRVGSAATYVGRDGITPGKLLVAAQNNYKTIKYAGKQPATQRNMAPPLAASA